MREELEQKIHEFAKLMYNVGYEDCKRTELTDVRAENIAKHHYARGLNDAWECARKIYGMDRDTRFLALVFNDYENVFENLSASEAIAKIKKYEEKQMQTEEWDSETMYGQFYEDDEGIKAQMQTNDKLCDNFDCAYNFKGECKNVEKCDDFKPLTKNKTSEQQIGKSCMNCKYHVTDFSNPNFPCFLIRRGHNCTNFSAWESNVVEELYSNEGKRTDDEIKVGDEVFLDSWGNVVIIRIDCGRYDGLTANGKTISTVPAPTRSLKKTGRHFPQIAEVLKQMQE